jgi:S-adenosylmethionine/arginine decarboxylase-like enzyme
MCYNCGCNNPYDDMGSIDNITVHTFDELATKRNKNIKEIKHYVFTFLSKEYLKKKQRTDEELEEIFVKAAKAWGQSVREAKEQTYKLLRQELGK